MKDKALFFAHLLGAILGIAIAITFACLIWFISYGEMPNFDKSPDNFCPPHDFSIFLEERDTQYTHYETYACGRCSATTTYIE